MYNISIQLSTEQDIGPIVQYIASLVEQATGQKCRISVVDNKKQNDQMKAITENITRKLENKENE